MTAEIISLSAVRSARRPVPLPARTAETGTRPCPAALNLGVPVSWSDDRGNRRTGRVEALYLAPDGTRRAMVEDAAKERHFMPAARLTPLSLPPAPPPPSRRVPVMPVRDPAVVREIRAELDQLHDDLRALGAMIAHREITLEQFYQDESNRAFEFVNRVARIVRWIQPPDVPVDPPPAA